MNVRFTILLIVLFVQKVNSQNAETLNISTFCELYDSSLICKKVNNISVGPYSIKKLKNYKSKDCYDLINHNNNHSLDDSIIQLGKFNYADSVICALVIDSLLKCYDVSMVYGNCRKIEKGKTISYLKPAFIDCITILNKTNIVFLRLNWGLEKTIRDKLVIDFLNYFCEPNAEVITDSNCEINFSSKEDAIRKLFKK